MGGDVGFGGTSSTGSWVSDDHVYSTGIGLPGGRAMDNGDSRCAISALYAYVSGRNGSSSVRLVLGSASTDWFSRSSAGSAQYTGWQGTNLWLVNGGSATMNIYNNSSIYFARGGSGSTVNSFNGYTWPGRIGGAYRWIEAPSAPRSAVLSLTSDPTELKLSWTAPADNGGSGVNGYRIRWWYEDTPGSVNTINHGTSRERILTGLQPGRTVVAEVAAKNAVTDAAGRVSQYSGEVSRFLPSGGRVWVDDEWVNGVVRVYVDGEWRNGVARVYAGGTWKYAN